MCRLQRKSQSTALFLKLIGILSCVFPLTGLWEFRAKSLLRTVNCATRNKAIPFQFSLISVANVSLNFKKIIVRVVSCESYQNIDANAIHTTSQRNRWARESPPLGEMTRKMPTFHIKTHAHTHQFQGQIIKWHNVCMWFEHWIDNDRDNAHSMHSEWREAMVMKWAGSLPNFFADDDDDDVVKVTFVIGDNMMLLNTLQQEGLPHVENGRATCNLSIFVCDESN